MSRSVWRVVAASKGADTAARDQFGQPEGRLTHVAGEATESQVVQAVDGACPRCGTPLPPVRRVRGIVLEWPSNEPLRLADFVWPVGSYFPLVAESRAQELRERFCGFDVSPVEVREHRLRVSDYKPGAPLPRRFLAQAQSLVELWPTRSCRPHESSTLHEVRPPCSLCGSSILFWGDGGGPAFEALKRSRDGLVLVSGVEYWETGEWDPEAKKLARIHHPRRPGSGLRIATGELDGGGLFKLEGEDKFVLCTNDVKRFIEERGCTNVAFVEAGELVD